MSLNYDRRIDLSVNGMNLTPSGLAADSLRVRFNLVSHTVQAPNMGQIIVTNLSDATASALLPEKGPVTLSVGYVDGTYGQIFSGEVRQVIHGERERGTDKLTRIYVADTDTAYNYATVTQTLAAGWKPQDVLDTLMNALQPYGVAAAAAVIGLDLSQPAGIRGITLSGAVKDHMRDLATSLNAEWSFQSGQVLLTSKDASLNGTIPVNSNTGMISQPRQTADGIYVTTLINPLIKIRSQIQVDQSSIMRSQNDNNPLSKTQDTTNALLQQQGLTDGTYTVLHQEVEGDSRGGAWYQYHTCIGSTTGILSKSQADYLGPS